MNMIIKVPTLGLGFILIQKKYAPGAFVDIMVMSLVMLVNPECLVSGVTQVPLLNVTY